MNYFRRWCAIVAASLALAASLISSAASQSPDSWARCKGNDPTAQITSCTAIIGASKGASNDLATAFDNRGTAYYRKGRYDLAIEDYNQAIRLNANEAALFLHRGAAYREWSANDRAIEDFNQAVKLDPTSADGFASRGNVYYRMRQYDRVIADESKAIELNPKLAFAFTVRGLAYADTAQVDRAIEDYSQAIKLSPNDLFAYADRAVAYVAKGQYDRAISDYDQVLKLDPNNSAATRNRRLVETGNQHSNTSGDAGSATPQGRRDEWVLCPANGDISLSIAGCTALLTSGLNSLEDTARVFSFRGNAYASKGQSDRAVADFEQAIKLNPKWAQPYFQRGFRYFAEQQYDHAIADYDKSLTLAPNETIVLVQRGRAYAAKGQYDRAVEDYDQALKLDPGDTFAAAMRRLAEAAKQGSNPGVAPSTPTAPGRAAEAVLTSNEVAGVFAQSAPRYLQALLKAPPVVVAQSYFSERYTIKDIHQFAKAGARVVVILNGTPHAITKENADAYIEGYSGTLALHEQAIEQRGFRQVGGNFAMKVVGPTCGQQGFADATVSIAQNQYRLTLEKGWPTQYEGLIIEDTIAIAAPGSYNRGVIGQGKVKADLTEINFGNCTVILRRP